MFRNLIGAFVQRKERKCNEPCVTHKRECKVLNSLFVKKKTGY